MARKRLRYQGQGLMEYSLAAALVAIACIAGVSLVAQNVQGALHTIRDDMATHNNVTVNSGTAAMPAAITVPDSPDVVSELPSTPNDEGLTDSGNNNGGETTGSAMSLGRDGGVGGTPIKSPVKKKK